MSFVVSPYSWGIHSWVCSIREAIEFSKQHMPDAFLAVGGGSVIDTAKLMNLYTCCPGRLEFYLFSKPS